MKTIDKEQIHEYYTKGWTDAHTGAPNNLNLENPINQYAYELGIIDFIFDFQFNSEDEIENLIKKKFN